MNILTIIDTTVRQLKGQFHLHTSRSPDCAFPSAVVMEEYRSKGFDFCLMTDHEVYWDSTELDTQDFLVLSGVENAFLPNPDHVFSLDYKTKKQMHFNLLKDLTTACDTCFNHDEVMVRPVDYGIDSWNNHIEFYHQHGQLVILNHPSWSHLDPEMMLAVQGCIAFELWNHASIVSTGSIVDEVRWDYCLERGKRIRAIATDDAHLYGAGNRECGGGFTMVLADEFSKVAIIQAMKEGRFYPSTGPLIRDMTIENGVLSMNVSPVSEIKVLGPQAYENVLARAESDSLTHLAWNIDTSLGYFRVKLSTVDNTHAWTQPVFIDEWCTTR